MNRLTVCMLMFWLAMVPGPGLADDLQGKDWGVSDKFKGKKARLELSGAVCPGSERQNKWCLAVNDEKRWAQFFSIDGNNLQPGTPILLLPKKHDGTKYKEIDAEGAAYDDGFVYVTGSHGLSRNTCKFKPAQFFVIRFPVDKASGQPLFQITEDTVASEIQRSADLRQIIKDAPHIGPRAEQCLYDNGANVEGLAVKGGQMFFGFRGPSLGGDGFVLEVAADHLFAGTPGTPVVHRLNLGKRTGIRDLASVEGGFLVLTGHVNKEDVAPKVYFWDPAGNQLTGLGELPVIPSMKAETVLVLDERSEAGETKYRVLVLYDGLQNGNPTEFKLERQH